MGGLFLLEKEMKRRKYKRKTKKARRGRGREGESGDIDRQTDRQTDIFLLYEGERESKVSSRCLY